jgi:hypothetical protein
VRRLPRGGQGVRKAWIHLCPYPRNVTVNHASGRVRLGEEVSSLCRQRIVIPSCTASRAGAPLRTSHRPALTSPSALTGAPPTGSRNLTIYRRESGNWSMVPAATLAIDRTLGEDATLRRGAGVVPMVLDLAIVKDLNQHIYLALVLAISSTYSSQTTPKPEATTAAALQLQLGT